MLLLNCFYLFYFTYHHRSARTVFEVLCYPRFALLVLAILLLLARNWTSSNRLNEPRYPFCFNVTRFDVIIRLSFFYMIIITFPHDNFYLFFFQCGSKYASVLKFRVFFSTSGSNTLSDYTVAFLLILFGLIILYI